MLSRRAKGLFYALASPLMRVNGWRHRLVGTPKRNGQLYVQLGPGQDHYLPGWINVDANMFTAKCDIWADLRFRLPFKDASISAMYSHQVVEHLCDLQFHFREVYRCLKPGGIYRVGGPNGDAAIKKFAQGDFAWFPDYPDDRKTLGGRFDNFIYCRQEHLAVLTFSYLSEIMTPLGFINIRTCLPRKETSDPKIFAPCLEIEYEIDFTDPHALIVEAQKPPA